MTMDAEARPPSPTFALFSPGQVLLACVVGSPVAGAILMALNMKRLGQPTRARTALLTGLGVTGLLIGLGFLLPSSVAGPLPMAGSVAMWQLAKRDEPAFEAHVRSGGRKASSWHAAGAGLACMTAVVAVLAFAVGVGIDFDPHVDFGHEQVVYHEEGATEVDARRVGERLHDIHFFDDRGPKDVRLSKERGAYVVAFVLQDGAWDRADVISFFTELRADLQGVLGGAVEIRLKNDLLLTKHRITG